MSKINGTLPVDPDLRQSLWHQDDTVFLADRTLRIGREDVWPSWLLRDQLAGHRQSWECYGHRYLEPFKKHHYMRGRAFQCHIGTGSTDHLLGM